MGKKYIEKDAIEIINKELKTTATLYKANCINWIGKTKDSQKYYTEIFSEFLIKNKDILETEITPIKRTSGYYIDTHHIELQLSKTNREEEIFAKSFYMNKIKIFELGEIIDFQIPLKEKQSDVAGKIDLLSYNNQNKTAYLIEFKYGDNSETLLRAVLEIFTYSKIIDIDQLKNDLITKYNKRDIKHIKRAVLVTVNTQASDDIENIKKNKKPFLKELINKLDVTIMCVDYDLNIILKGEPTLI